jgi:phage terminase large subunit-like protein
MRENLALNPQRVQELEELYGGTELGRQELEGELLETLPGALWIPDWFRREGFRLGPAIGQQDGRLAFRPPVSLVRVVVALDPSVSDPDKRTNPLKAPDACGVSVVGLGDDHRAYVLGDFTEVMAPADWARLAVRLFTICGASSIIAEKNQGGQLIEDVIRGVVHNVPVELVSASESKRSRAEPVSLLYEQGRVSHCGEMPQLERQMTTWDPTNPGRKSPNNIDSLVWAFHGLGLCVATGTKPLSRLTVNR